MQKEKEKKTIIRINQKKRLTTNVQAFFFSRERLQSTYIHPLGREWYISSVVPIGPTTLLSSSRRFRFYLYTYLFICINTYINTRIHTKRNILTTLDVPFQKYFVIISSSSSRETHCVAHRRDLDGNIQNENTNNRRFTIINQKQHNFYS